MLDWRYGRVFLQNCNRSFIMKLKSFLIQLLVTSLCAFLILIIGFQFEGMESHGSFLGFALMAFVSVCLLTFHLARKISTLQNKNAFTQFTLGHTFMKMFLLVAIVIVYKLKISTGGSIFIWPFIGMYIIFTIFETHFLLKLARQ